MIGSDVVRETPGVCGGYPCVPSVYLATFSAASSMSSRRIVQSLGSTDGLGENAGAESRSQTLWHDQIDSLSQNLL